jgi:hypothetical protein
MKHVIRRKPYLIPLFLIIGAGAIALFGWIVMTLWNVALVPAAGANIISFWQALGLLVLSRILVGGFGGGKHRRGNNNRAKWMSMTPEEKAAFRNDWKQQCGNKFDNAPATDETTGA